MLLSNITSSQRRLGFRVGTGAVSSSDPSLRWGDGNVVEGRA